MFGRLDEKYRKKTYKVYDDTTRPNLGALGGTTSAGSLLYSAGSSSSANRARWNSANRSNLFSLIARLAASNHAW